MIKEERLIDDRVVRFFFGCKDVYAACRFVRSVSAMASTYRQRQRSWIQPIRSTGPTVPVSIQWISCDIGHVGHGWPVCPSRPHVGQAGVHWHRPQQTVSSTWPIECDAGWTHAGTWIARVAAIHTPSRVQRWLGRDLSRLGKLGRRGFP